MWGMRGTWGWDTLELCGAAVVSGVLTAGAVPAGAQDLQEIFPFQRQHLLGQLHLPATGEWGWGRGAHGACPAPALPDAPVLS